MPRILIAEDEPDIALGLELDLRDEGYEVEVVGDGENGYLLPVGEVEAMAERAVEILSDDALRRRMGAAGRAWAVERFDEEKIVPQYLSVYQRVLGG